jgi:hypothetical protein
MYEIFVVVKTELLSILNKKVGPKGVLF